MKTELTPQEIEMKLHSGSVCGKYLGLYPPQKKYCGGTAYIVSIEDEKLRFDIYCKDVTFEPMQNQIAKLSFDGKDYNVPYKKIKNTINAAMDACGFTGKISKP